MEPIRTAVIGVGYLGQYHAEKYAQLPNAKLVAVCDVDPVRCSQIAQKLGTNGLTDYRSLVGKVDAVSIAAPTQKHFELGMFFLENGIHVLMEKPIATTLDEAEQLVAAAKRHQVILQVGHLERFNNAFKALESRLDQPMFIESVRNAPFKLRGADVNVVLDLMIHDIDLIQSIVKSPITDIRANGTPVLSPLIDIASARIEYANGCVANITASRVSVKTERRLTVFQKNNFINLDLDQKILSVYRKGTQEIHPNICELDAQNHQLDKGDALKDQIEAFVHAVEHTAPPVVSGEDGRAALNTAIKITHIARQNYGQHLDPITV